MDPENRCNELKYQLTLANDLIIYLSTAIVHSLDKAKTSELLGQLMKGWNERVDIQVDIIRKEHVAQISENSIEPIPTDVADIIVQAHEALPTILRDEFIEKTLNDMQTLIVEKK